MSRTPHCPKELKPLLCSLIDPLSGEDTDVKALEELLQRNAAARVYYLHFIQLHAELQLLGESPLTSPLSAIETSTLGAPVGPSTTATKPQSPRYFRSLLALSPPQIAVLMALLCISAGLGVLAVLSMPTGANSLERVESATVARLISTHQCIWAGNSSPRVHQTFEAGESVHLESGQAEIRFADGAEVLLIGPAELRFDSGGTCQLSAGDAMANVPPRASGFTIHTPTAMVVDLGTSFAVSVSPEAGTQVHVFLGKVGVQPGGGQDEGVEAGMRYLTSGQALQVDDQQTFKEIAYQPDRFVRRTPNVAHITAHPGGGLLRSDGRVALGGNTVGVRRIGASRDDGVSLVNVLLFRLPAMDDPSRLAAARLSLIIKSIDGNPDFSVDLYGLGYLPAAAIKPHWFYEGAKDQASPATYGTGDSNAPVTRLEEAVIAPTTRTGRVVIRSPRLAEFIADLYRQGAQEGDVAVFRLNATSSTQNTTRETGYNVVQSPAMAGRTSAREVPVLSIYTNQNNADDAQPDVAEPHNAESPQENE